MRDTRKEPLLRRHGVTLILSLTALLIGLIAVFLLPLADCPNCTGPAVVGGKVVVTDCRSCELTRVTLFRRWTWPSR